MEHDVRDHDECLDPVLGEQLWRLELTQTDPALRKRLEAHLRHCPACATLRALDAEIAAAVREGDLAQPV